jgi:hypothetical protein
LHFRGRIPVVLVVVDVDGHVEHLLYRRRTVRAVGELRHVVIDATIRIDSAVSDERADRETTDRLRHAHQQVQAIRAMRLVIVLGNDLIVADHDQCVGVAPFQPFAECRQRGQRVQSDHRTLGSLDGAVADPRRGHELRDMSESPPVVRSILPGLERQTFFGNSVDTGHAAFIAEGVRDQGCHDRVLFASDGGSGRESRFTAAQRLSAS